MNHPNHLIGFETKPLSFWRRAKNYLIDFEVTPMTGDLGSACFVARHGGGIRLIIDHELAHYIIDQIDARPAPFLILFDAERGGRSTLVVERDILNAMRNALTEFIAPTRERLALS